MPSRPAAADDAYRKIVEFADILFPFRPAARVQAFVQREEVFGSRDGEAERGSEAKRRRCV